MSDQRIEALIAAARAARLHAHAPFSGFLVGAALEAADGRVFTGCNVESASYGLTCCAERVALFRALTDGLRGFSAIAVVARAQGGPMPCGACRQLLREYAPNAVTLHRFPAACLTDSGVKWYLDLTAFHSAMHA